jgi:putative heme-binding domain-containing protein
VNGRGSRKAPDLTDIGTRRSRDALERALRDPAAAWLPVNRSVRAVTRDGRTILGRRLNEDTHTVQLMDDKEQLVSLEKDSLREYRVLPMPLMPTYATELTSNEIADVVAYLSTLTGRTP